MKINYVSVAFRILLFAALFGVKGTLIGLGDSSGEITVYERSYSTQPERLELPSVAVPSLEEQINLYRNLYMPYAARVSEEPQFAISGFEDLIDIAFSYAWKHTRGKSNFKQSILELFYMQAMEDAAQNRMTLAAYKQHILRLGVVLSVNAQAPFKNKNLEFFNEKSYALYFRNPDQMNTSSWMFEAILFVDNAQLDYGTFVQALADENMPLLLSALSTEIPQGFGNSAGFLRHDYGHNYRTAAYANIPIIRTIINKIRSAKPQLDAKDNVMLFYMFHELMLKADQNRPITPDEAFHLWCVGTRKGVVNAFFGQIVDDEHLKGLLLPQGFDSNQYRRGIYELISNDTFQLTLASKNQPFKNYLKAQITIACPGQYLVSVVDLGPKLLQDPIFMNAFKNEQVFDGACPQHIYAGQTENKMFKERIEDLRYIYGNEAIARLANDDDYRLLLLFLETWDSFYHEHQYLFE